MTVLVEMEITISRRCFKNLFSMGFGFTEFLQEVFFNLPLRDVVTSRLVCKEWRDFIDK